MYGETIRRVTFTIAAIAALWVQPLHAQSQGAPQQTAPQQTAQAAAAQRRMPPQPSWTLRTGAGVLLTPAFLGADEYQVGLFPDVKLTIGQRFFASVQDGIGYRLIKTPNFSAGPLARPNFGRPENGENPFRLAGDVSDDLIGLGEIESTFEFGGFAQYRSGKYSVLGEVRQAVSGHEGLAASLRATYGNQTMAFKKPFIYSVGPNLTFGDGTFTNAFFGVTQTQSTASGLPVYDAGGGLVSAGANASGTLLLNRNVSMTLLASYNRLTGDVADAPLVAERGARDQFVTGVFLSYTWLNFAKR